MLSEFVSVPIKICVPGTELGTGDTPPYETESNNIEATV